MESRQLKTVRVIEECNVVQTLKLVPDVNAMSRLPLKLEIAASATTSGVGSSRTGVLRLSAFNVKRAFSARRGRVHTRNSASPKTDPSIPIISMRM